MKKNMKRGEEQKRKPLRLTLSRETIQVLTSPALLKLARALGNGGGETSVTDSTYGTYSHPELTTC